MLRVVRILSIALSVVLLAAGASAQTIPVADPGPDQLVACEGTDGAQVTLDGSASFDPDVDPNGPSDPNSLTYTWTGDALDAPLDGAVQLVDLPAGVFVFTLVVDDGIDGASLPADVEVTVGDGSPPVITLSSDSASMWPPNHSYHAFGAGDFVESVVDACGAELGADGVSFTTVSSDEPDNSNGDGNTVDDILYGYGCRDVLLRAERRGPGDGRVYTATLGAADASGLEGQAVITVSVPKNRGKKGAAVDSGPVHVVDATPEACQMVALCPSVPDPNCIPASDQATLQMDERSRGDRLKFRAKGFAIDGASLGEGEAGVDYQLCIYVDDGSVAVETAPAAPSGDGWKSRGRGQSYKARGMERKAGLSRLGLRSRGDETDVKAKGDGVDVPPLPLPDGSTVVVQLHGSDGSCLETSFDGEPQVNSERRFKARR